MSATITAPMTVAQARRRLSDTSRLSAEQIEEAQKIITAFHDARPPRGKSCVACNCAVFSEHETADGNASWACSSCHRPASLTPEAWRLLVDERAAKDAEAQARIAASTPKPRDALQAALQRRAEAATTVDRLEAAQVAARRPGRCAGAP